MQIYLSSHDSEASLVDLVQQALAKHALENIKIESIPPTEMATQKNLDPETLITLTTLVLQAAEIHVISTHLVRFLETLVNKKVDVKIQYKDTSIELSGSAGHIEKNIKRAF